MRAIDDRGADVGDTLSKVDRRFVDGFPLEAIRGYARRHTLTLDLADPALPVRRAWSSHACDGRKL